MKKILPIFLFVASPFIYADTDVTKPNQTASGNLGKITFTTEGASLITSTGVAGGNIYVNSGVSGSLLTQNGALVAYNLGSSGSTYKFEGAGKDVSTLTYAGYVFNAGGSSAAASRAVTQIENLTMNFQRDANNGNNLLRVKNLTAINSVVNILSSTKPSEINLSDGNFTLRNSTLNIFGSLKINSSINIGSGSELILKDTGTFYESSSAYLQTAGSTSKDISGGIITIEGYYGAMGKIRLNKYSTLKLNSSNIATGTGYRPASEASSGSVNFYDSATLEVNAQNDLTGLCVTTSNPGTKEVTLKFGDRGSADYLLKLDYLVFFPSGGGTSYFASNDMLTNGGFFYNLESFSNGDLVFSKDTITQEIMEKSISQFLLNGEAGKVDFESTTINGTDYWAITAIPEPSEWAAIFGAFALGFVVYRRRK